MASRDLVTFENGKYKRRVSSAETLDFLSVKVGTSGLEMKENSGAFDFSAKALTDIGNAVADTDAPAWGQVKAFVAEQVLTGGSVKQALLTEIQLDNTEGILPGLVIYLTTNAVANDTVVLKDAAGNTETYTFKASKSAAFEVAFGATPADSMSNLAAELNLSSAYWKAWYDTTVLDSIYTTGLIGIYRKVVANSAFKIWVTGTTGGFVTDYHTSLEYKTNTSVLVNLGNTEPATALSGFSIAKAALTNGEIHNCIAEDKLKYWNGDFNTGAGAWFTMSEGVIPVATSGSGGSVLGKATYDSDKGVEITGIGVVKAKIDNVSTYFDGSGNIAIKAAGVNASKLNSDVAGIGLVLNGTSNALDVNIGNGIEITSDAVAVKPDITGGANLAKAISSTTNGIAVKVDDSSIEGDATSGQLKVKALGIATGMIAANAVTAAKLNADVVGAGTKLNGTSNAIEVKADAVGGANLAKAINVDGTNGVAVKVDGSSIEGDATTGQLKIKALGVATGMLAANSVTAAKLNSDTAGAGIVLNGTSNALDVNVGDGIELGGAGSDFVKVKSDVTGGANLAKAVNVGANGVAVKVDDSSIEGDATTGQLKIKALGVASGMLAANSVTAAKLNSDVAGAGLVLNGTTNAVDVATGDAIKISSDAIAVDFAKTKTNDNAGSITAGQVVYVKSNGNVDLAKANVVNLDTYELGLVEDASIATSGSGKIVLRRGAIVGGFSGLTPGKNQYVSRATAGALVEVLTGFVAGEFVYSVGRAISATEISYDPEFIIEY